MAEGSGENAFPKIPRNPYLLVIPKSSSTALLLPLPVTLPLSTLRVSRKNRVEAKKFNGKP